MKKLKRYTPEKTLKLSIPEETLKSHTREETLKRHTREETLKRLSYVKPAIKKNSNQKLALQTCAHCSDRLPK